MSKVVARDLPLAVSELIRRMTPKERMALASRLSWEEMEEWKATAEVVADKRLMRKIRAGLQDIRAGRVRPASKLRLH